jgi:hypothetical protein
MYEKVLSRHTNALLLLICFAFLCVHGGLFLFDLAHPDAILHGDRAHGRLKTIMGILEATPAELPNRIFNSTSGVPGDFLQHTVLYGIGGPYLVIVCQIILQMLTLVMIYVAAVRLTGKTAVAVAAGLFMVVMPSTLMNPHLLTSETWFAALLTAGALLVFQSVDPARQSIIARYYYPGVIILALASAVRPQGLLVPAVVAICLLIWARRDYGKIIAGVFLGYLIFPVAWMTARFLVLGDFSIGGSDASLVTNLAIREDRILSLPIETHATMTPAEFLQLAAAHPWATFNTFYSDVLNLLFNPGINHVLTYYLGMFPFQHAFWEGVRDRSGLLGVAVELLRQNGGFVALFAIWTVIHFTIVLAAGISAFQAIRDGRQAPMWVHISLAVTVLIIGCALAAGEVRWNHRAGVEPLLALLAAYGLFGGEVPAFLGRRSFASLKHST